MKSLPLLLRRGDLKELLADHGISGHAMKEMISDGRIQRKFLPESITAGRKRKVKAKKQHALYSLAQIKRDILDPLLS